MDERLIRRRSAAIRILGIALLLFLCAYSNAAFAEPGSGGAAWSIEKPGSDGAAPREEKLDLSAEMNRAGMLMNDRRYDEAITVLERITDAYPRIAAAVELLSQCYLKSGRSEDAVRLLEARVAADPRQFSLTRNLGLAYLDLGRKEKAVETWERLLTGEESSAGYYGVVAGLEQDAGLYEEALRTYDRGRRFEKNFVRHTLDIVRLERLLGRPGEAFREGIVYLGAVPDPSIEHARFLIDIFREAGRPDSYVAAVDSAAAASPTRARLLESFKALLLVEAARYDEAWRFLDGEFDPPLAENDWYAFISALSGRGRSGRDESFRAFYERVLGRFLERYGRSTIAPGVMLIAAEERWESARRNGAPDSAAAAGIIALADGVITHRFGAPYVERAVYLKALAEFEGLHAPAEALATLERVTWRGRRERESAEELRIRVLLASGDWEAARRRIDRLAAAPDSVLSVLGRYGQGRLAFLTGRYDESVAILSELAEKHAGSEWANDALETAMMVKAAAAEGAGALDLFRAGLTAADRGELAAAIDSLAALGERYPESSLAPRALYLRAGCEERAGRRARALADLDALASSYPLHELAPRALERIAALLEEERPGDAERRYEQIIERYPDDPFLGRVRARYMALRESRPIE